VRGIRSGLTRVAFLAATTHGLASGCEPGGSDRPSADPGQGGLDRGERCTPAAADPCGPGLFCGPGARCREVGSIDAGNEDDRCGHLDLTLRPLVPTVVFVIDRSGSMRDPFRDGPESRWDVLETALFGTDLGGRVPGIIRAEEDRVRFGLAFYSGIGGSCPDLIWHRPRLGAPEVLRSAYVRAAPMGSGFTPTGDAVTETLARVETDLEEGSRTFFVLATDGEPDRCGAPGAYDAVSRAWAVDAVADAFDQAGIVTFVLSLGDVDATHLADVADAGVRGSAAKDDGDHPAATFWSPAQAEGLREALGEIVGEAFTCRIPIEGDVSGRDEACRRGTVILDDRLLTCGDDEDGFRVRTGGILELLGRACEQYLTGEGDRLRASFPCPPIE